MSESSKTPNSDTNMAATKSASTDNPYAEAVGEDLEFPQIFEGDLVYCIDKPWMMGTVEHIGWDQEGSDEDEDEDEDCEESSPEQGEGRKHNNSASRPRENMPLNGPERGNNRRNGPGAHQSNDDDDENEGEGVEINPNEEEGSEQPLGPKEVLVKWIDGTWAVPASTLKVMDRNLEIGEVVTTATNASGQFGTVVGMKVFCDLAFSHAATNEVLVLRGVPTSMTTDPNPLGFECVFMTDKDHKYVGFVENIYNTATVRLATGGIAKVPLDDPETVKPFGRGSENFDSENYLISEAFHPGARVRVAKSVIRKLANFRTDERVSRAERQGNASYVVGVVEKLDVASAEARWLVARPNETVASAQLLAFDCPSFTLLDAFASTRVMTGDYQLFSNVADRDRFPVIKGTREQRSWFAPVQQSETKTETASSASNAGQASALGSSAETTANDEAKRDTSSGVTDAAEGPHGAAAAAANPESEALRSASERGGARKKKFVGPPPSNFEWDNLCGRVIRTRSIVEVDWQDGTTSKDLKSVDLLPKYFVQDFEFGANDFILSANKQIGYVVSSNLKERTLRVRWFFSGGKRVICNALVSGNDMAAIVLRPVNGNDSTSVSSSTEAGGTASVDQTIDIPADGQWPEVTCGDEEEVSSFEVKNFCVEYAPGNIVVDVRTQLPVDVSNPTSLLNANTVGNRLNWAGCVLRVQGGFLTVQWSTGIVSKVRPWEILKLSPQDEDEDGEENEDEDEDEDEDDAAEGDEDDDSEGEEVNEGVNAGVMGPKEDVPDVAIEGAPRAAVAPAHSADTDESNRAEGERKGESGYGLPSFDMWEHVPSDHRWQLESPPNAGPAFMRAISRDLRQLASSLPNGVFVRAFGERTDLLRVAIVGPSRTPYFQGLYFFDVRLPSLYPRGPPEVYFRSFDLRIHPNLYADGNVCLSLLGTWSGESSQVWDGVRSSLLQVFVSLQGLVLGISEPYFNEAGYEKQRGTHSAAVASLAYNEQALLLSLRMAARVCNSSNVPLDSLVQEHFSHHADRIVNLLRVSGDNDIGIAPPASQSLGGASQSVAEPESAVAAAVEPVAAPAREPATTAAAAAMTTPATSSSSSLPEHKCSAEFLSALREFGLPPVSELGSVSVEHITRQPYVPSRGFLLQLRRVRIELLEALEKLKKKE